MRVGLGAHRAGLPSIVAVERDDRVGGEDPGVGAASARPPPPSRPPCVARTRRAPRRRARSRDVGCQHVERDARASRSSQRRRGDAEASTSGGNAGAVIAPSCRSVPNVSSWPSYCAAVERQVAEGAMRLLRRRAAVAALLVLRLAERLSAGCDVAPAVADTARIRVAARAAAMPRDVFAEPSRSTNAARSTRHGRSSRRCSPRTPRSRTTTSPISPRSSTTRSRARGDRARRSAAGRRIRRASGSRRRWRGARGRAGARRPARGGARGARRRACREDDADARGAALSVLAALRAAIGAARRRTSSYQAVRRGGGEAAPRARAASAALEEAHPELPRAIPDLLLARRTLAGRARARRELAIARLEPAAGAGDPREPKARGATRARQGPSADRPPGGRARDLSHARCAAEPASGLARFELASLLWNRDRDAEARTLFTQIVAQTPPHPKRDDGALRARPHRRAGRPHAPRPSRTSARLAANVSRRATCAREARWRLAWMPLPARRPRRRRRGVRRARQRAARRIAPRRAYWRGRVARAIAAVATRAASSSTPCCARHPTAYYADLAEQRARHHGATAAAADAARRSTRRRASTVHAYHWSAQPRAAGRRHERRRGARAGGADARAARRRRARAVPARRLHATSSARSGAQARHAPAVRQISAGDTLAAYLYPRAYWSRVHGRRRRAAPRSVTSCSP